MYQWKMHNISAVQLVGIVYIEMKIDSGNCLNYNVLYCDQLVLVVLFII